MAILIREYLGSPINGENSFAPFALKEGLDADTVIADDSIMVDIEGIHVGPTRNYTWYTEQALKSSIKTWTNPYQRPLILHHNERDGKIIGRVLNAHYTDFNTRSNTGALVFTCNVPDEDGKKGVKDGRLKTVSIGVIAHDVKCSICGHDITEYGECEHERGVEYDGQTCYWVINKMEAKELSYVIVPSDIYAHNVKIYSPDKKKFENLEEGVINVAKAKKDIQEGVEPVIIEDADKMETPVAEPVAEEPKAELEIKEEEPKAEEESIDALKAIVADLNKVIDELKAKLDEEETLRKEAENELVSANAQMKEFAAEHILMLREQLGRPAILKEKLLKRSQDSLMDTIFDLKEELSPAPKAMDIAEAVEEVKEEPKIEAEIEIKEAAVVVEEPKEEVSLEQVAEIEKPIQESLLDEEKDSSIKKEIFSELDVKESEESSNNDYEATLLAMKFFNIEE